MEKFNINFNIKKYNVNFDVCLVWFTYLPFIGWMYPFLYKKDDAFAMDHAKQALVMAVFFFSIPIILTFSTVFIPISYHFIKLIVVIMIYLSHLTYFALCAWGFRSIKNNVAHQFPIISEYAKKIQVR